MQLSRAERTQINTQLHQVGKLFHSLKHVYLKNNKKKVKRI